MLLLSFLLCFVSSNWNTHLLDPTDALHRIPFRRHGMPCPSVRVVELIVLFASQANQVDCDGSAPKRLNHHATNRWNRSHARQDSELLSDVPIVTMLRVPLHCPLDRPQYRKSEKWIQNFDKLIEIWMDANDRPQSRSMLRSTKTNEVNTPTRHKYFFSQFKFDERCNEMSTQI